MFRSDLVTKVSNYDRIDSPNTSNPRPAVLSISTSRLDDLHEKRPANSYADSDQFNRLWQSSPQSAQSPRRHTTFFNHTIPSPSLSAQKPKQKAQFQTLSVLDRLKTLQGQDVSPPIVLTHPRIATHQHTMASRPAGLLAVTYRQGREQRKREYQYDITTRGGESAVDHLDPELCFDPSSPHHPHYLSLEPAAPGGKRRTERKLRREQARIKYLNQ
eukprot:gnl/Dysnectes_brevis/5811_a8601_516.p1 GENE.gnl/Dysnectes_brevis/5811_a8601_516~~gnl/Dysnectes_brevis/5811_a8601_516.p1  ORF type:complete len:216 (+),score=18.09 gnl/Dysnectes_brevis/5811_a8601_516:39-686(+)